MSKVLSGGQLVGGNPTNKRQENDFYATDPQTTNLFLNEFLKEHALEGDILECACGQGHMAKVLKTVVKEGKSVICTDLIDRGYGQGGVDFLTHDYKRTFNTVITNPPFSLAQQFIERGLEIADKYVIMLCRVQLLEGVKRKDLFENTPLKYVYVHTSRQAPWKDGNSTDSNGKKWSTTMCLAWFVWDKEYTGSPIIRWV